MKDKRTQMIIEGSIGSSEGVALAKFLNSIGRVEVIDEFYAQIDRDEHKLLSVWLLVNHPDLMTWYKTKERLTNG